MSVPEKYGLFTKEFFHREQAKYQSGRNTFLKSSQLKSTVDSGYRGKFDYLQIVIYTAKIYIPSTSLLQLYGCSLHPLVVYDYQM